MRHELETTLQHWAQFELERCGSLEDLRTCDAQLVLVDAHKVPDAALSKHIQSVHSTLRQEREGLAPPVLFIHASPFEALQKLFAETITSNCYFDVVAPTQLNSLPLRLANLLRFAAHLQELATYDKRLRSLEGKLQALTNARPPKAT